MEGKPKSWREVFLKATAVVLCIYYVAMSLLYLAAFSAVNRGSSDISDKLMLINISSFVLIAPASVLYIGKKFKNYLFIIPAVICVLAPIAMAELINEKF